MLASTRLTPLAFNRVIGVYPLLVAVLFMCLMTSGGPGCLDCRSPIELPFVPYAPVVASADSGLRISVQRDGLIFLDAKWYPAYEFETKMREIGTRDPAKPIRLHVDRELPFGTVRSVLRTLQAAGFKAVTAITFDGSPAAFIAQRGA